MSYEGIADNTGAVTRAIDHSNNLQYDYTYDSTDRLVASSITDATTHQRKALFEYNFDLNNNLSKFTTLSPSGHNKTEYTYGNDNLLTAVSLDNSKTLNFTYDGIGHLRKHTLDLQTPLSKTYTYHGIEDANENNRVYKSNLVRDETIGTGDISLENGNYQIQNKDFAYRYHYDANDNIIRLYNTLESEDVPAEEYTYDSLGMLEEVRYNDRGIKVTYFYDECGNILSESYYDLSGNNPSVNRTINYSYYGDIGDLLTAYDGDTITYDEIGNPLQYRDGISFTWSNGRQLQSYTKGNTNVSYTYDGSGMRLTKDVGNTHYTYLYRNGLLVQETIGDSILDYSYTSGGQVISVRYKANANDTGTYYYYALNSRGDVIGLYDEEGNLHAKYTYDVWGNPVSITNASGVEISSPTDIANIQPLRYRSYYYDADTGFYYLQSRYYDPVTHRFINADGLVSTGTGVLGYNMFDYCENNPIRYSDSSGNHLDDQFKWNKMQREKKDKEARREKDNQAKADYETLSKLRNIAQSPNNTVFYDDTRTYKLLDGIQYESNVSSGIILHYSDDMSVVFSKKGYSITQQMFLNGFTTLNGSYTWRSSSNTAGCQFNNFSVFCGMDQESNHLIGWDYSVEHENNIIGSSSGTLIVSNDTYNTIQTIAVVVGVGALVAPFAPEILAAVGSFASAGAAILVPLYSAI